MSYDKNDNRAWVSASKAGRAEFCPKYLQHEHAKAKVSKGAIQARARGEQKHEILNRKAEDKRCYVATHLYGQEDERTLLLRAFRDSTLKRSLPGQLFIKIYYLMSPAFVVLARRYPALDKCLKLVVDPIVKRLEARHE